MESFCSSVHPWCPMVKHLYLLYLHSFPWRPSVSWPQIPPTCLGLSSTWSHSSLPLECLTGSSDSTCFTYNYPSAHGSSFQLRRLKTSKSFLTPLSQVHVQAISNSQSLSLFPHHISEPHHVSLPLMWAFWSKTPFAFTGTLATATWPDSPLLDLLI